MKIEVKSAEVGVQSGTSKRTGKPYSIRKQVAWLHTEGEPYPQRFELQLGDEEKPYEPGLYETENELFVDARNFNRLGVSRSIQLVRVAPRKVV